MFSSRRRDSHSTTKSFTKGYKVNKSSSSFSKDAGVSKRRHDSRRRPTTASTATTDDPDTPITK